MNRNADFSPQGPETDQRVWSLEPRSTIPRSCGLKSAFRVLLMAVEHVRQDQGTRGFTAVPPIHVAGRNNLE